MKSPKNTLAPAVGSPGDSLQKQAEQVVKAAGQKIKAGLEKPTASTGTLMQSLSGGPLFNATLSNIGGGSKASGGGGMQAGWKTCTQFVTASAVLQVNGKSIADLFQEENEKWRNMLGDTGLQLPPDKTYGKI